MRHNRFFASHNARSGRHWRAARDRSPVSSAGKTTIEEPQSRFTGHTYKPQNPAGLVPEALAGLTGLLLKLGPQNVGASRSSHKPRLAKIWHGITQPTHFGAAQKSSSMPNDKLMAPSSNATMRSVMPTAPPSDVSMPSSLPTAPPSDISMPPAPPTASPSDISMLPATPTAPSSNMTPILNRVSMPHIMPTAALNTISIFDGEPAAPPNAASIYY